MGNTETRSSSNTSNNKSRDKVNDKKYGLTKYRNSGKKISPEKIQEIFRLRALGWNKLAIANELGLCWATVNKYCTIGETGRNSVPSKPIDEQVAEVRERLKAVRDYNIEQAFLKTLTLVGKAKEMVYDRMLHGGFVQQVTPLMVKQLAEAERLVVTVPGELYKQQRDLYDQLRSRDLGAVDAEFEELGEAGDLE